MKHENHTPIGAFKVRGGLNLLAGLAASRPVPPGIVSATRGNHGQSLAFAAKRYGIRCVIVVPRGNSADKNVAMRAFGSELVGHGRDFGEAREHAGTLAREQALRFVGPFEPELVAGVGTYALELVQAVAAIDTVYVPIGCSSGICGLIGARDALGLSTDIVGVVPTGANAYAQSFAARRPAIVLSGGNVDRAVYARVLTGALTRRRRLVPAGTAIRARTRSGGSISRSRRHRADRESGRATHGNAAVAANGCRCT